MEISFEQAIKGFQLYSEAAGKSRKTYLWYENNLKSLTGQILYKQSKIKSRSKLAKRKPDLTKIEVLPSLD